MANDTQLVIRMPAALKAALDSLAARQNMTSSEIVRRLLAWHLMPTITTEDAIDD